MIVFSTLRVLVLSVILLSLGGAAFASSLTEAIRQGRADEAMELLKEGADPHAADDNGRTPLHFAARKGEGDLIQELIARNVLLDPEDRWGRTPLFEATQASSHEGAALLLRSGAEVNHRDKEGLSPLHTAAISGNISVLNLLLRRGANLEARSKQHGRSPLHLAAEAGHLPTVRLLIEQGALPNLSDDLDQTPISLAERAGHEEVVSFLATSLGRVHRKPREKIAKPIAKPRSVATKPTPAPTPAPTPVLQSQLDEAWQQAIRQLSASALTTYLEMGGNLDRQDKDSGHTLLHQAAKLAKLDTITWLLQRGAKTDIKNVMGFTPLQFAAASGKPAVAILLQAGGANLDPFSACALGETAFLQALLKSGVVSPNLTDDLGQSLLHWCAIQGMVEPARVLLSAGANPLVKAENGLSPMDLAARQGHKKFVDLLKNWKP